MESIYQQRLKLVYKDERNLDFKLPMHTLSAHTLTKKSHAMKGKKEENDRLHECVYICVDAIMSADVSAQRS